MTSDLVRESVRECEKAFDFLVSDLGYRRQAVDFGAAGFSLRYEADVVGVQISWHVRDVLTVDIIRLPDDRFDLEDVEIISGYSWPGGRPTVYSIPIDEDYLQVADSLRTHAADLIRGDLTRVPQLEQRKRARQN